ncbi:MAG: alpha/beta hydrolase-fold protein [Chloroflexota bacterium]
MNRKYLFLWGIIFTLGLNACSSAVSTPEVPPTTPPQEITPSPSNLPLSSPTLSPTPTHQPPPTGTPPSSACWGEGGQIEEALLDSEVLKEPLVYRVYIPPCYDQQTSQRYPVLYLMHGQGYNDDQWDRLGIDEIADNLISKGEIGPLIIVMPYEENDRALPPENPFGEVLTSALIPAIDQIYRTTPRREQRAIGGLSRGGNWAIHIGFSTWELFGSVGAHSTPTFATDGVDQLREYLAAIPAASLPRIYMDIGDHDFKGNTRQVEAMLTDENIPHQWHLFPGYHEEAYWVEHIEDYLRWYAAAW